MNRPESFPKNGGLMPSTPKELPTKVKDALQRLRDKVGPQIEEAERKKALELAKHGLPSTTVAVLRPNKPAMNVARPTNYNVPLPTTPPVKPYVEVDQHELFPDGKGGWVRKEE